MSITSVPCELHECVEELLPLLQVSDEVSAAGSMAQNQPHQIKT